METVTLAYGPLTIDGCNDDNWTAGTNVTKSNETTAGYFLEGDSSTKLAVAAGANANGVLGYRHLAAPVNLTAYTHVIFWFRSSVALSAGDLSFGYDDAADLSSPIGEPTLPAAVANEWTMAVVALTGTRTSVDSVGITMEVDKGAFDFWIDDIRAVTAKTFSVLAIRGLDEPDEIEFYPAIAHQFLDGSKSELMLSYCRVVTITFGVLSSKAERTFLVDWSLSTTKRVIWTNDDMDCVMADPGKHSQTWLADFVSARSIQISVKEKTARTTQPVSWGY